MSTNPISWAAPTAVEPLVADFSTTSVPEGKIRLWRDTARAVPPDTLCDATGRMSSDPEDLYSDPPGFLLPLGGERFGHKGSALALLAEVAAILLSGDATDNADDRGNNLALLAVRGAPDLADRVSDTVRYRRRVTRSAPSSCPGRSSRRPPPAPRVSSWGRLRGSVSRP